jgi:hypothetical protein
MKNRKEKIEATRQNNFVYLFAGLLILLLVAPVTTELHTGHDTLIFQLALDATLLLGIWSVVNQRHWFIVGVVLSLIGISISITDANLHVPELKLAAFAVVLPFYSLTAVLALRYILSSGEKVNFNILMGAICVYMLMGIIWAIIYSFLHYLVPGSFSGLRVDSEVNRLLEFIYYSFVTLTTLGYGDLLPVNPIARALAYMEALIGQIYVAVLIAGLVSIHISNREKAGSED